MVNILDVNGAPLLPTKRYGRVRRLLKDKQASIISYEPFTIQLHYAVKKKNGAGTNQ